MGIISEQITRCGMKKVRATDSEINSHTNAEK
jgi:hypothetical protein